jgi:hypothetical protein
MSMGSVAQCLLQRESVCYIWCGSRRCDRRRPENRWAADRRSGTQARSVIDRSLEGAIRHCGSL